MISYCGKTQRNDAMAALKALKNEWSTRYEQRKQELNEEYNKVANMISSSSLATSATSIIITDDYPRDLKAFQQKLELPGFKLQSIAKLEANKVPIGADGKVDMRLYPAERPAAQNILKELKRVGRTVGKNMILAAVSGSGKTSVAFDLGGNLFTIYIVCMPAAPDIEKRHSKHDVSTFPSFENEVERRVADRTASRRQKTEEARRIATVFLASHLFALYHFLSLHPDGTPFQFLCFQLSRDGAAIVEKTFNNIRNLSEAAGQNLAQLVANSLEEKLVSNNQLNVLLVIDEMEAAATLMDTHFVSRNLTPDGEDKSGRGLLTPLLQAAGDTSKLGRWDILVMGTGSVLARSESVTSDIGKGDLDNFRSEYFPFPNSDTVNSMLKTLLPGVDDILIEAVPEIKDYLYDARFRLLARTIENFISNKTAASTDRLEVRLQAAVRESVDTHKSDLLRQLNKREGDIDATKKEQFLYDLHQVYMIARLSGTVSAGSSSSSTAATTSSSSKSKNNGGGESISKSLGEDWCKLGIAQVSPNNDFRFVERFAFETVRLFFDQESRFGVKECIAFRLAAKDLENLALKFGITETGKGDLFERLVSRALCFAKGTKVTDLPFVHLDKNEYPKTYARWSNVVMNISNIGPIGEGSIIDAERLQQVGHGIIISPSKFHRADGISLFDSKGPPNEELYEMLLFSAKFYSNDCPSDTAESQFRSTDPAAAYQKAKTKVINEGAAKYRDAWELVGLHQKVALRLHITLPRSQKSGQNPFLEPGTFVQDNDDNTETIIVSVENSNVREFFSVVTDSKLREEALQMIKKYTKDTKYL